MVRSGSKNGSKKICLLNRKYSNHSKLNSQHNGGGELYDYLIRMRIFSPITNKIFI